MLHQNDIELMNQFIDKFSIVDDVEFKKATEEYATQLPGMTIEQFKKFVTNMKSHLVKMSEEPIVIKYLAILNRMEKVI